MSKQSNVYIISNDKNVWMLWKLTEFLSNILSDSLPAKILSCKNCCNNNNNNNSKTEILDPIFSV